MLFNSFIFWGLCLATFALYYIPRLSKLQIPILILASLIFYSYKNVSLVLLLLFSAGINIFFSYAIANNTSTKRKIYAMAGVTINLLGIAFFKYSPLIAKTLFSKNSSLSEFLLTIPLPIGISFFTFEGISLLIDVLRKKQEDTISIVDTSFTKHAGNILFFISFFPHLVSGPILKANDFLPQIKIKYFKDIEWEKAFKYLILGYFLKMVVADNLKDFTAYLSFPTIQWQGSITLLTLLWGYSCQIFSDFAGYSLIAIGLSKLFGYTFIQYFNFPYISTSFKEFWKRWHISLSSFLMEYLYFPLGGNKKGRVRTYINLMITMILGGLWHGAAWSYVIWGIFHGLALSLERLITFYVKIKKTKSITILKGGLVFTMVTFGWLLFKLPNFSDVIVYFKSLKENIVSEENYHYISYILIYSSPVILYHIFYLFKERPFFSVLNKYDYLCYGIFLFLILTNSGTSGSFIYFQF